MKTPRSERGVFIKMRLQRTLDAEAAANLAQGVAGGFVVGVIGFQRILHVGGDGVVAAVDRRIGLIDRLTQAIADSLAPDPTSAAKQAGKTAASVFFLTSHKVTHAQEDQ